MPAWLSFILGFLADWLKRLSDPEFERKQDEIHREVREREEAAKRQDERVAGYRAENERIDAERAKLATEYAATDDAIRRIDQQRQELKRNAPTLENLSDYDAVRVRLPLE